MAFNYDKLQNAKTQSSLLKAERERKARINRMAKLFDKHFHADIAATHIMKPHATEQETIADLRHCFNVIDDQLRQIDRPHKRMFRVVVVEKGKDGQWHGHSSVKIPQAFRNHIYKSYPAAPTMTEIEISVYFSDLVIVKFIEFLSETWDTMKNSGMRCLSDIKPINSVAGGNIGWLGYIFKNLETDLGYYCGEATFEPLILKPGAVSRQKSIR